MIFLLKFLMYLEFAGQSQNFSFFLDIRTYKMDSSYVSVHNYVRTGMYITIFSVPDYRIGCHNKISPGYRIGYHPYWRLTSDFVSAYGYQHPLIPA